jgi:hypothetical protein
MTVPATGTPLGVAVGTTVAMSLATRRRIQTRALEADETERSVPSHDGAQCPVGDVTNDFQSVSPGWGAFAFSTT